MWLVFCSCLQPPTRNRSGNASTCAGEVVNVWESRLSPLCGMGERNRGMCCVSHQPPNDLRSSDPFIYIPSRLTKHGLDQSHRLYCWTLSVFSDSACTPIRLRSGRLAEMECVWIHNYEFPWRAFLIWS